MTKKHGLGRGLEALIPPPSAEDGVQVVAIERIVPNLHQPRQHLSEDALNELAESIRAHGVIQPLVVTQAKAPLDSYQLIAGERRWRAARLAGLATVPVVVREATTQEMLELALVENIQRADLDPLEEAAAYRTLMDAFDLTQEQVAQKVGKGRVAVANAVRLLKLPEEAKRALSDGQISEGHARALLRLETAAEQLALLQQIIEQGLSVRQAEEQAEPGARLRRSRRARPRPEPVEGSLRPPRDPQGRHLEEQFRRALGTKVTLQRNRSGGGRLIIQFFSDEELDGVYQAIVERKGR
ncbi:MAG: ParB/RepB/Spo0J family partition protein [Chloroflexi bacterium]|nr:ParB/RepB/Spo0J family partition protein [Chloroflexota bacterium]MBI3734785.1 ParB/RepB/Spo0J family partition protein [Chloroflexota bacterium]